MKFISIVNAQHNLFGVSHLFIKCHVILGV